MTVSGTLYTPEKYYRSHRVEIAAKISGFNLKKSAFVPGKTDEEPSYKANYLENSCPVFETQDKKVHLFDASAIARFVGNEQLRGGANEAQVIQWCNWADNVIAPAMATWVYPCLGVTQFNKSNTEKAKNVVNTVLKNLNEYLTKVTYLVGERLTQADVTVFCNVVPLYENVLDKSALGNVPHFTRWFTTIANHPSVKQVIPNIKQCAQVKQFDPKKFAELHPKGDTGNKEKSQPQAQKKKETPKKEEKKPKKPVDDDDDDDIPLEKPKKDPLADLPKGNFDMDAWKRTYSNKPYEESIPYFWENYDPEHYSIWYCEYKYNEELTRIFMSCNLIGGMFQRLERLKKHGFGVVSVFGVDGDNNVSGVWFWKGTGLVFELSEDLQVDYEVYTWKKLDHKDPKTKELVDMYWADKYPAAMRYNQGKIFK